jgi:high-affinity iron transporter
VLADSGADWTAAFLGSLTILLREGLEALLVVVAMIAFLRKAERPDVLGYVHAGWVTARLAGAATWGAATYLVTISGANREVTEGLSSLFAAAVLVSVGVWMHQKSVAGQWQTYLRERMSAALNRKSALFMFGLAFIAVSRGLRDHPVLRSALGSGERPRHPGWTGSWRLVVGSNHRSASALQRKVAHRQVLLRQLLARRRACRRSHRQGRRSLQEAG